MVDLKTLQEDFSTARANTSAVQLNTIFTGSYGTTSFSGGLGNVNCGITYGNAFQTAENYTWDGTGLYWKPTPAPKGGSATAMETFLAIAKGDSTDDSIRMSFNFNTAPATPTLKPILYNVDNTYNDVSGISSINYNATTHAWLGMSYDSTLVHWWRSADGLTWTEIGNTTKPSWLNGNTLTFIYSTNRVAGSDTNANLDNFNINGNIPGAPIAKAPILARNRPARIWSVNS